MKVIEVRDEKTDTNCSSVVGVCVCVGKFCSMLISRGVEKYKTNQCHIIICV